MKKISIGLVLVIAVSMIFSGCKKEEVYRVVKINHFDGEVTVLRDEKMNAFEGLQLISEDTVETGESSKAELLADSDKHILAEENTKFVLKATGTEKSGNITINLLYGTSLIEIENKLTEESYFEVTTPNATLSVRGTTFEVNYDEETETTSVEVIEGVVAV
ncbi:MAG: FecR domain-containing protein, partial [Oscillospiraceae bacterium]|nr:FecR domain-containing protein [Oscillospiraceae bacterium]